jgi:hypothetical protein
MGNAGSSSSSAGEAAGAGKPRPNLRFITTDASGAGTLQQQRHKPQSASYKMIVDGDVQDVSLVVLEGETEAMARARGRWEAYQHLRPNGSSAPANAEVGQRVKARVRDATNLIKQHRLESRCRSAPPFSLIYIHRARARVLMSYRASETTYRSIHISQLQLEHLPKS